MQYNFDFTILNLDGTEITSPDGSPVNASKLLSTWIMNSASSNAVEIMKYHDWAMQLYKTGKIDLDAAGHKEFRTFVENLIGVAVIIKVAIFDVLKTG